MDQRIVIAQLNIEHLRGLLFTERDTRKRLTLIASTGRGGSQISFSQSALWQAAGMKFTTLPAIAASVSAALQSAVCLPL